MESPEKHMAPGVILEDRKMADLFINFFRTLKFLVMTNFGRVLQLRPADVSFLMPALTAADCGATVRTVGQYYSTI